MSKTCINLESTVFDMKTMVHQCEFRDFLIWENGKEKLIKLPDFGTVFVGSSHDECEWLAHEAPEAAKFICPDCWQMPQLVKALGAFDSTNQAKKNGWNFPIPVGIGFHLIRINKIRGMIVTMNVGEL
jgi:hypothetical protein